MKVRPFVTDPPTEVVTLDDYRRRHRLYRLDPDLQLLTSKVPYIPLTDDHDSMNNPWMTFAENHQPTGLYPGNPSYQGAGFDTTPYPEGDFYLRIQAAMNTWFTYMPIRDGTAVVSGTGNTGNVAADFAAVAAAATAAYGSTPYFNTATNTLSAAYVSPAQAQAVPGAAAPNVTALLRWQLVKQMRSFTFPGLMTYALTEDRLSFRTSAQATDQNGYTSLLTPTGPATSPVSAAIAALNGSNPALWSAASLQAVATAYKMEQSLGGQYSNCSTDLVDGPACYESYNNPNQHIIGTVGVNFVASAFKASKAASVPFQVWASQTCFFPSSAPDVYSAHSPTGPNSQAAAAGYYPRAASMSPAMAGLAGYAGKGAVSAMMQLPWNQDGWDGFQAERQQHLTSMAANGANVIINSGDAHTFWVSKLSSNGAGATPNMAEFCGGSVTSPGWGEAFGAPAAGKAVDQAQAAVMTLLEDGFMISDAPNLMASRMPKGALVFRVTPTTYTGQIFTVNNIATRTYTPSCDASFLIPANAPGTMIPTPCVSTIGGNVPGPMAAASAAFP